MPASDAARGPRAFDRPRRLARHLVGPTFSSLRIRNYRHYAGGQLVSNIGTWMQRIAQDWLVVQLTAASGIAVGTTVALQFLPMLLLSLWGGVIADRFPKRRILMVTRSSMGFVSLALGVLAATGVAAVWHVYALAFALGVVTAVDNPTRQSFVVEVVGRGDLQNAVGLNSATFNLARVVGPAIAGLIISLTHLSAVLFLSAATYVGMLAALARMRRRELLPAEPSSDAGPARQLRDGLAYVRARPHLLLPIAVAGALGTFGFNFQMMLALVSKETFAAGAGGFGLLSTAIAVGSLSGALVAARRRRPRHRIIVAAGFAFGLLEIACGLAPSYGALMALLVPAGMAALTMSTSVNAYLQLATSAAVRGRVMALYVLVFLGGKPIATPLLGWVGDGLGARSTFVAAGAICVVATGAAVAAYAYSQRLVIRPHVRPYPGLDVRSSRGDEAAA